jgi:hypothetical protein
MTAIHVDSPLSDDRRRTRLYCGDVFVYSPNRHSNALCEFARSLICEAFEGRNPELAQYDLPVESYARVLAELKPKFIHHPRSKEIIRDMLLAAGCDGEHTYFDVPRLRTATSDGYLSTGIAYAFHPHRDTWYSAPMCQINWWMPVYAVDPGNVMAFHPQYWERAISNTSADYDYQRWNATSRFNAASHVKKDTRVQPKALEDVEVRGDLRVVAPVGGYMMFSGAQLHSTVPNDTGRTRFSIDFRTVHSTDASRFLGARNVDSRCTGTAMTDYLRVRDFQHLPAGLISQYMPGHPQGGVADDDADMAAVTV